MELPIFVGAAAGAAALTAYINAKYHIVHDLKSIGGITQSSGDTKFLNSRIAQKRVLTHHVFQDQVRKQPNHPFLVFEGKTWSYKEFSEAYTRVANWLVDELGVQVEEIVAIDGGNSPEHLMLWFALDAIGAVTSFLNWNLTGAGLVHCIKLCNSRFVIADIDVKANVEPCRDELEKTDIKIHYYNPSFFSSLSNTTAIPDSRTENIKLESVRSLLYTSGTTGLPKGVCTTSLRELMVGWSMSEHLNIKPESRMYTCMPLYHGTGHSLCTATTIHGGDTVVLGRKFSHKTFWPGVAASKANIIQYVGELCRHLLNGPKSPYERDHKVQMAWGNGMRPDVWELFRERFNIPVIHELFAATDGLRSSLNCNAGPFTANCIGL